MPSCTSAPGITRDRNEVASEWNGREFTLIDTGGMDLATDDPMAESIREQAQAAGRRRPRRVRRRRPAGLAPRRRGARRPAAPRRQPVILAANKVDDPPGRRRSATSSTASASASRCAVSATQGLGTGDLLDRVVELLPEGDGAEERRRRVRLALIGRPNVGKSSLVNKLPRRASA